MAVEYDFEIEQGATLSKILNWKDKTGWPVDLSGYTAKMQVRKSVTSEEVLLTLSTANNTIKLSHKGQIEIYMSASATSSIAWTKGKYDLEITSPDGVVKRLIYGVITVSPEITRD